MKRFFRPAWLVVVFLGHALCSFAQTFNYLPSAPGDDIAHYDEFTLSYNSVHRQPNWVAYELTANELGLSQTRKNYFRPDHTCGTRWAELQDYKRSGFDRGHLCRAEFCMASEKAYRQSFLLSNISPQIGRSFNRTGGIWYNLEELEKGLARRYGAIYSVSGPVFKDNLGAIGPDRVTIPGYFFKVFFLSNYSGAIAFLVRHEVTDKDPMSFAITVDSLEAFTGIDFYPCLPDSVEDRIESRITVACEGSGSPLQSLKEAGAVDSRCKAIVKSSGKRCTRSATSADGYCTQHKMQLRNRVRENLDAPVAERCKAITRSGKRCQRRAGATGYCWQHSKSSSPAR